MDGIYFFFTFYSIQINVKKYSTIIVFFHLLSKVKVFFETDLSSWDCEQKDIYLCLHFTGQLCGYIQAVVLRESDSDSCTIVSSIEIRILTCIVSYSRRIQQPMVPSGCLFFEKHLEINPAFLQWRDLDGHILLYCCTLPCLSRTS